MSLGSVHTDGKYNILSDPSKTSLPLTKKDVSKTLWFYDQTKFNFFVQA